MPNAKQQHHRRHTDGDGDDAVRAAHRSIAEYAYRLYVEGHCDRNRAARYWLLAKHALFDRFGDRLKLPDVAAIH